MGNEQLKGMKPATASHKQAVRHTNFVSPLKNRRKHTTQFDVITMTQVNKTMITPLA